MLKTLEAELDCPEFDIEQIITAALGVTPERWARYVEMMCDDGLVKGARVYADMLGGTRVDAGGIRITLKGLEYLAENTVMQRLHRAAKGVKESVPGL
jgi:hypothetical protein